MDRNASPMTIAWIDSCSGNNDLLCWAGGMRFPADGSHQNHSYPSWWRKGSVSMGLLNTSSVPGSWSAVLFVLVVCSLVRLDSLCTKEKYSRRNLCSAKKRGAVASWGPLQGDPRASIPAAHCWSCRARVSFYTARIFFFAIWMIAGWGNCWRRGRGRHEGLLSYCTAWSWQLQQGSGDLEKI